MKAYLLGQYEKSMPDTLSILDKIKYSKQFGFDYLELCIDNDNLFRLNWDNEEITCIKDQLINFNFSIKSLSLDIFKNDFDDYELSLAYKAVDFASKLDIKIIKIINFDDNKVRVLNNLKKLVDYASKKAIIIGLETVEVPFLDTVEKAMEYINEINSNYLQIIPDIGNLTNASLIYNKSIENDLEKGVDHIIMADLKEVLLDDYHHIPYGSGHTAFIQDIELLKNMNIHTFTGEWDNLKEDKWQDDCQQAYYFLKDKLDKVYEC